MTLPFLLASLLLLQEPVVPEPPVIAFVNGAWFDGEGFVPGTRYSVGGFLALEPPERIDLTLDLDGQWVVPPYGEAHTHFLEPDLVEAYGDLYLRRGVFYARDQGSAPLVRRRFEERLNRSDTLEFVSAHQGFTGPGGHPLQIVAQMQALGALPAEWGPEELRTEAVFVVETEDDVARVWPAFLAGKPDFVKVFLLCSEVHAQRHADERYRHRRGLDPALVPPIVARARAAGLEVSAHVYTRADFRAAVDAGVDLIAHLPGVGYEPELPDEHWLLTEEDARLAAERGVVVVTTLSEPAGAPGAITPAIRAYFDRIIVPNLARLEEQGVELVIGSDRLRMTSDVEAFALLELELFEPLTLLRMWCETTPRSIFPERRIGRLLPDHEASFLVLEGDPLEDFANTRRIALRVKSGQLLFPREPRFPELGR